MTRELAGLLVDPVDGCYPGALRIAGGVIASVARAGGDVGELRVLPGFSTSRSTTGLDPRAGKSPRIQSLR